MPDDLRLIEDYLPIEAISAEASCEKSVRKGHISTLHLWWARRPLVACRAAVYGALVPADRWVKEVELKDPPADAEKAARAKNGKKRGLNRKAAKEFVTKLCRYPKTNPTNPADVKIKRETVAAIVEAQKHILEAHADRLTTELAEAKKTGKPPAWVEEFHWPFSFNREPTASASPDATATPNAIPAGSRLNDDSKTVVTYDDIIDGRAPRPRVLDMFARGGAIPLEALRLGCEAYALDLNPVAHIIELCTLVYPQKYGKPDPMVLGMTGPPLASSQIKNHQSKIGNRSWGGLAAEVRYWGNWVLDRVHKEIGDLYPPIPDPAVWDTPPQIAFDRQTGQWNVTKPGKPKRGVKLDELTRPAQTKLTMDDDDEEDSDLESQISNPQSAIPPGFLQPVAYLWTRTVRCKNPGCAATVPLVRQTWLCQRPKRYVALRMNAPKKGKQVSFTVVESETESGLGFDPTAFSKAGNATCPFCGTVADSDYVKSQGCGKHIGQQLMAIVCYHRGARGVVYLSSDDRAASGHSLDARISATCERTGFSIPDAPIVDDAKHSCWCRLYGFNAFRDLYLPRQLLFLLTLAHAIKQAHESVQPKVYSAAIGSSLTLAFDRLLNYCTTLCVWRTTRTCVLPTFSRQALPLVWDFGEMNPYAGSAGDWCESVEHVCGALQNCAEVVGPAITERGSATENHLGDSSLDAVITDPPYYDNVPYANLSDFFYVWMRQILGDLHLEHLTSPVAPKKMEIVADACRHNGSKAQSRSFYENMLGRAFAEAVRALKPGAPMSVVYAHKTTLGWATLVDALRRSGALVTEAWPIDTEMAGGMRTEKASLASSIFLIARKRQPNAGIGNYEDDVQPDLQQIVRERVETLWELGIAGADLVIACVGAGLRAFTKYEKVEYANGEEVPAEKFLAEVEGVVLDTMMGKLLAPAKTPHPSPLPEDGEREPKKRIAVSAIDPASRFYVLWRFVYKAAEIDAGEAIVFTYAQHVELDGPQGLSAGKDALVERKKAKYRARDFTERGNNEKLGLPDERQAGKPVPLIDALHRVPWLMENSPRKLAGFLHEAATDRERLRVLAQTLAGAALSGKSAEDAAQLISTTAAEQSALGRLLANWRSVIDDNVFTPSEQADKKRGQKRIFE